MIKPLVTLALAATALISPTELAAQTREAAGAARLDAAVRVEPVSLPSKKGGLRELTYSFGKRSAPTELAELAEEALIDRAYFQRRAGEGPADYRLELSIDRARSSHEDFGEWQSRPSTVEVSCQLGYRWLDAEGRVVSEGEVPGFARISVEGIPRKPDSARAWAKLIDDAVARVFSAAFEAAAFGNVPPPKGGWILAPEKG